MNKKIKTLLASALLISGLAATASAGTIAERLYDNKGTTSTIAALGSGSHTLYARGAAGTSYGTASAMQVVSGGFDKTAAKVTVDGTVTKTAEFQAINLTSNGTQQSYYIKWSPSKSSSAYIGIRH